MKRFFAQLKKLNVRRAVLSKTIARVFVGLIACLLWDRFLNSAGRLSVLGHAFMAVGLLFAAFAWMHYLSLDGFKLFPPAVRSVPKRRAQGGMTDALNEDPDADVLDKQERTCAALAADLCAAVLFFIPSLLPCRFFYHFQRPGTALPSMLSKGICIHSSTEGRMSVMHIFGICWGATSCP